MKHLTVLFVCVVFSNGVHLPANFIKCNRREPDWNGCLLKASQNAVAQLTKPFPELNLPSFDPLEIPGMSVGAGSGPVNLEQNFRNCKLYGLAKLQFNEVQTDFDKKVIFTAGKFPEMKKECDYEINGKVLLFPVVGKGRSTFILKNVNMSAYFHFEEVPKKNKTYMRFVSSDIRLDPSIVFFNFENLFDGHKILGDSINKALNENWQEVFDDVKSRNEKVFNQLIVAVLNNFYGKVSIEEAYD